ncbi:unnamed protein product [Gulo gulo]|uniref:Uncharacterized protein n=1 Tax=Gulo gulo TaxID=48420 RepID=A0A9X9Q4U3_GULGU|nr:unnamed protein product [Gulo gulo]
MKNRMWRERLQSTVTVDLASGPSSLGPSSMFFLLISNYGFSTFSP